MQDLDLVDTARRDDDARHRFEVEGRERHRALVERMVDEPALDIEPMGAEIADCACLLERFAVGLADEIDLVDGAVRGEPARRDEDEIDLAQALEHVLDHRLLGEEVTRRLGCYLADNGWAIVSGLARGIDHVAHETALAHDARTVAVLGSGLDALASERQRDLLQRILDAGGAAVTEQPFGREADPGSLIKRNRIQSGLALATFVMQSKRTSGTMQTARYTLMQDRALYVPVPPGAHAVEEVSQGNLMLAYGTGPDLAEAIGAKNSFVDLVRERWSDRPPASPIANRNDYARVLAELEARLGAAPAAEAEEAMSPAPR